MGSRAVFCHGTCIDQQRRILWPLSAHLWRRGAIVVVFITQAAPKTRLDVSIVGGSMLCAGICGGHVP